MSENISKFVTLQPAMSHALSLHSQPFCTQKVYILWHCLQYKVHTTRQHGRRIHDKNCCSITFEDSYIESGT